MKIKLDPLLQKNPTLTATKEETIEPIKPPQAVKQTINQKKKQEIITWIIQRIEKHNLGDNKMTQHTKFSQLGLDSVGTLTLLSEIEEHLHCKLPPDLLYQYESIDAVADYLASEAILTHSETH
jgi:acyl carrier protein